ncbi:hypothetical protein Q9L58_009296 [Maublancomyces gigas]|uniref:Uncharacterized protein n=1 Tax=Discina gigas TaxID=1032678 RepID=A0ABR3G7B8_9PEZI
MPHAQEPPCLTVFGNLPNSTTTTPLATQTRARERKGFQDTRQRDPPVNDQCLPVENNGQGGRVATYTLPVFGYGDLEGFAWKCHICLVGTEKHASKSGECPTETDHEKIASVEKYGSA